MIVFMQRFLFFLLLVIEMTLLPSHVVAQERSTTVEMDTVAFSYPVSDGIKVRYEATIEMKKGYLSGICVLLNDAGIIKGSLFNEFGISAIDFAYDPKQHKVKLYDVIQMMNKWYIKRVLRKDLALLLENLRQGISEYRDEKYQINYKFTVLKNAEMIEEKNNATEE